MNKRQWKKQGTKLRHNGHYASYMALFLGKKIKGKHIRFHNKGNRYIFNYETIYCDYKDPVVQEARGVILEIDEEIGIGLKAGIGRADNMEDAAYMADIGLEIIRAGNNKDWIHVIEEL